MENEILYKREQRRIWEGGDSIGLSGNGKLKFIEDTEGK